MAPPTKTSIMLVTGEYFDPFNHDPSVINLDVLAHGLQAPRFNNQTIRPISIAEHSLRVRRVARELAVSAGAPETESTELWALLHDAHEALVPWGDCLRPGKTDKMREVEAAVDSAIFAWLDALPPPKPVADIVKTADSIALYFEAMLWQPGAIDWAPSVMTSVLNDFPGVGLRGGFVERFMPLIAPRPRECWRTEVEALLGACS